MMHRKTLGVMEGVLELREGYEVELEEVDFDHEYWDTQKAAKGLPSGKRLFVCAYNEGEYNSTAIDILDLINQPELLEIQL